MHQSRAPLPDDAEALKRRLTHLRKATISHRFTTICEAQEDELVKRDIQNPKNLLQQAGR